LGVVLGGCVMFLAKSPPDPVPFYIRRES
jgi:hypothetical protein